MSTLTWPAVDALRRRVSMSAMGSVIIALCSALPTRLHHARDLAPQRALAKADAAHAEPAHVGARPPAQPTAVVLLHGELCRALRLRDHRFLRHLASQIIARTARRRAGRACPSAPAGAAPPGPCAPR